MEKNLKNSTEKYKRTLIEESIKEFTYRYFAHKPTENFKEMEVRGCKVTVNKDVVNEFVHFTARFIFGGVEVEIKF
jgi:hypothetical protein